MNGELTASWLPVCCPDEAKNSTVYDSIVMSYDVGLVNVAPHPGVPLSVLREHVELSEPPVLAPRLAHPVPATRANVAIPGAAEATHRLIRMSLPHDRWIVCPLRAQFRVSPGPPDRAGSTRQPPASPIYWMAASCRAPEVVRSPASRLPDVDELLAEARELGRPVGIGPAMLSFAADPARR